MRPFFLTFLASLCSILSAQVPSDAFKVIHGTDTLAFPWIGGMDNPRFNNIDLNADGKQDIVLFDRRDGVLLPFLHIGNPGEIRYRFAPEYINAFPKDLYQWILILDYNCDNEPDLFTRKPNPSDIIVYRNATPQNGYLSFELAYDNLLAYNMFNSYYPINSYDIPAIADIDLDGDIDFLIQDVLGTRLEFYRNEAAQCGDFDLQLHSACWGHFSEFSSNTANVVLNQPCSNEYKTLHQGGAYLALQLNGDTLMDVLLTDDGPENVVALYNGGTKRFAHITQKDTIFPNYNIPIHLHYFPALFYVDVDADGKKDLIAAVNGMDFPSPLNPTFVLNSDTAAHLYKNTGTNTSPIFQLHQKDFFFDQTIDGGSFSNPLLFDEDQDGDLDLLILTEKKTIWTGAAYAQRKEWRLYRNITNNLQPTFQLQTTNYQGFNQLILLDTLVAPHPALADLDADGDQDLFVGNYNGNILFLENIAPPGSPANFQLASSQYLPYPLSNGKGCYPHFADVDQDNDLDLLIGRENGTITYVENLGNASSPTWASPIYQWKGINVTDSLNPFVANAKPFWFDYNQDQQPDLLVGNHQGELHLYQPNPNGNYLHQGTLFNRKLSQNLSPFLVQFHPNDSVSLFLGNAKGGLYLYRIPKNSQTASLKPQSPTWQIEAFPNPCSSNLTIQSNYAPYTVTLLNAYGQKISENLSPEPQFSMDVQHLAPGVYLLQLQHNQNLTYTQFIKIE